MSQMLKKDRTESVWTRLKRPATPNYRVEKQCGVRSKPEHHVEAPCKPEALPQVSAEVFHDGDLYCLSLGPSGQLLRGRYAYRTVE